MKWFITGTDTDVGKTVTAAVLSLALQAEYWKPVQTGLATVEADANTVLNLTGLPKESIHAAQYNLPGFASPHLAAAEVGIEISLTTLTLPKTKQPLIIEGAGGVLVPLNQQMLMRDLIAKWQIPAIIVARGTLGTINHTLLTIEALRKVNIPIAGVIYCGELLVENQRIIEHIACVKTLFHLPYFSSLTPPILQAWVKEQATMIRNSLLCQ